MKQPRPQTNLLLVLASVRSHLDRGLLLLRGSALRGDGVGLLHLGLGEGAGGQDLVLGLHDGDVVGQGLLGAHLAVGVPREHDLDLEMAKKERN